MSTPNCAMVRIRFPEGYQLPVTDEEFAALLGDLEIPAIWQAEIVRAPAWAKERGDPPPPDKMCAACGCPIKFVKSDETGRNNPLDLRSPCYRADGSRDRGAFVSHYRTCSDPAKFSKGTWD